MRRRLPTDTPAELGRFVLEDWADGPADGSFARYQAALHAWLAARHAFEDATGWDGDPAWWNASHEAIVAMPDEPFDPSSL